MDVGETAERCLALELAGTIRHDGNGGVADDLSGPQGLTAWVRGRAGLFDGVVDARGFTADEQAVSAVVSVREAVRALFARAVSPTLPSKADAHRLISCDDALERINTAARRVPTSPQLAWPTEALPFLQTVSPHAPPDPQLALCAALARSAIDFLTGPQCKQLRACTAPRCVRYFLKGHARQEFCKPSCSNRARAARHYQRHRPPSSP
ncbi:CGNR zinc finger domain-containing protein [Kitasatospora sp. NPDC057940]|uniref:CGNR zinc finger domain-containing protein n=1 Tax=Kitasatospora sp. NPDC057940 TaxID=3346285 RepID=UPI0036DBCC7B